jgi:Tol biopolymer transport system component
MCGASPGNERDRQRRWLAVAAFVGTSCGAETDPGANARGEPDVDARFEGGADSGQRPSPYGDVAASGVVGDPDRSANAGSGKASVATPVGVLSRVAMVGDSNAFAYEDSLLAHLSGSGRFIAFASEAETLIPEDVDGEADVFLFDRQSPGIELVSVSSDGEQGNANDGEPTVSDDGSVILFTSLSNNLDEEARDGTRVFRRDRNARITEGIETRLCPYEVGMSSDGAKLVWEGRPNCRGAASTSPTIAFVMDAAGEVFPLPGEPGVDDPETWSPALSRNGRWVVWAQRPNGTSDSRNAKLMVSDLDEGTVELVPVSPEFNFVSLGISDDGRYLVYSAGRQVYLYDAERDELTLVSRTETGTPGNDSSFDIVMSADAGVVVFTSLSSDLDPDDTNEQEDVFIFDPRSERIRRASVGVDGQQADGYSRGVSISADGRVVAFVSDAQNLVAAEPSRHRQLYTLVLGE